MYPIRVSSRPGCQWRRRPGRCRSAPPSPATPKRSRRSQTCAVRRGAGGSIAGAPRRGRGSSVGVWGWGEGQKRSTSTRCRLSVTERHRPCRTHASRGQARVQRSLVSLRKRIFINPNTHPCAHAQTQAGEGGSKHTVIFLRNVLSSSLIGAGDRCAFSPRSHGAGGAGMLTAFSASRVMCFRYRCP